MSLGRLVSLEKKLEGKSDQELLEEIETSRQALREFRREHRTFRDVAHRNVDVTVQLAQEGAARLLEEIATLQAPTGVIGQGYEPDPRVVRAAALLAVTRPEFVEAWHAAIDAHEGFSPLTADEFATQAAKLEGDMLSRQTELERRRIAARREEAEAELAGLEAQL